MKRNLTRMVCLILVFVLLVSLLPAVFAYSGVDDWAEEPVAAMDELGLIPESLQEADMSLNISRLDMCRTAVLAYEKRTGAEIPLPQTHPFTDTTDPDAEKAFAAGLIKGDGNGTFRPDDSLTRLEFFCFADNLLQRLNYPITEACYADLSRFTDAASLPEWGLSSARITVGLGIVRGTGTRLDWKAQTARQEALTMFHRAYLLACGEKPVIAEVPPAPAGASFPHLADWAKESVLAMNEMGLVPATVAGTDMRENISRLDMCRAAVLAYEKRTGTKLPLPENQPFTDTLDPAAEKAFAAGLVSGDGDGTFRPNDSLTRVEFFCFADKLLHKLGYPIQDFHYADISRFEDAGTLPEWGRDSARLTVGLGIVQGTGKRLDWASQTSKQEALTMFYRTYMLTGSETTEPDPDQPESGFINLADWAEEQVLDMDRKGLIPDELRSVPMDSPITRVNVSRVIMRAYKQLMNVTDEDLGDPGKSPFSDTSDPDVLHAYRLGIIKGSGDGTFSPDDPMTRQDFFTICSNFLHAVGYKYQDDATADLTIFSDSSEIDDYAKPAARLMMSLCDLHAVDGKLRPRDATVCQEALAIFHQLHTFITIWSAEDHEDDRTDEDQDTIEALVELTKQQLGKPYVYGGKSPETGFDCSGLVYYIYKQFGYTLNPGATTQWKSLPDDAIVPRDQLLPGDLIFFSDNGQVSGMTHVGIYIGDGQMIHAENSRTGVVQTDLGEPYYVRMYLAAKRVIR